MVLTVGWLLTGPLISAAADPLSDLPVAWYEDDQRPIAEPAERDPNLHWDMVNDTIVRPLSRMTHPGRLVRRIGTLFGSDHVRPAANLNSLDEVPNSTWFTHRIGLFPMTPEQAALGPGTGRGPNPDRPWEVVSAKTAGVTPGFVVRDSGGDVYLIKFDPPGYLGMATRAGVVSNRILHAAGYNVPDDAVVTFRPEDLLVADGARIASADGSKRPMTEQDLRETLEKVEHLSDGRILAISSKFVSGKPVGCFDYHGRRRDDPNDRIPHHHRREVRALSVFCAWLNHFDTKQHNSLDAYEGEDRQGYVRHYLIDLASTLGAGALGPAPRHGWEYTLDAPAALGRILALGGHDDKWRYLQRPAGLSEVGYFESDLFDPREFKSLQPNSAFVNLTPRDGYWAAKIISAFSDRHLEAIVAQAEYQNPDAARTLVQILAARRDKIARAYFGQVPPLDFFVYRDGGVTFHDLGVERGLFPAQMTRYRARAAMVSEDRRARARTEWRELTGRTIPLRDWLIHCAEEAPGGSARSFWSLECQVDRGRGWSRSVTVYISPRSSRVVALDR
jgi:hypothetical protein